MRDEIRPVEPIARVQPVMPFTSFSFQQQDQYRARKRKGIQVEIKKKGTEDARFKKGLENNIGERVDYKV